LKQLYIFCAPKNKQEIKNQKSKTNFFSQFFYFFGSFNPFKTKKKIVISTNKHRVVDFPFHSQLNKQKTDQETSETQTDKPNKAFSSAFFNFFLFVFFF